MTYNDFKHIDPDEYHGKEITLHDCTSDKISVENNSLRFFLPDGFWVTPHHKANLSGRVIRTDASVVDFSIEDIGDIMVHVFTRNRWLWFRKINVEIWDMEQLIAFVNSGKCTVEFITQYRTYGEQMWHCAIHSKKEPYYRESGSWFLQRYDRCRKRRTSKKLPLYLLCFLCGRSFLKTKNATVQIFVYCSVENSKKLPNIVSLRAAKGGVAIRSLKASPGGEAVTEGD